MKRRADEVRVIRRAGIVLILVLPVLATAQETGKPEPSNPAPGSAISVPPPAPQRGVDVRQYDIPELAGAEVVRGSFLVNGKLPKPVADYQAVMAGIQQRVTIFQNGIVTISLTGTGGTIRKRVMIPLDALQEYKKVLAAEAIEDVPNQTPRNGPNDDHASLRIYRDDGSFVERRFNPVIIQNVAIGKPLFILNDLLRALSEDREVTNSLAGYAPRVGDHLIADDEQVYRVVRIIDNGKYIELMSTREPLTLYVATAELHNHFIGKRRFAKRDE